jgi:hypothetical protein
MMEHSQVTAEAAQRIIDKIVSSRYPVAAFLKRDGLEYVGVSTKRFDVRFLNSPHDLIGIYNCNVSNVHLMDDLAAAGIR